MIDRRFRLSDEDKIFGTLPINITINTVSLAAQEIVYRNWQLHVGGTLALAQVRRKFYNQMMRENY